MYHIGLMSSYTEDIGPSPNYKEISTMIVSGMIDITMMEYLVASVILVALLIVYNKE